MFYSFVLAAVSENPAVSKARARALLKVDTELSILTNRTRKLLLKQKHEALIQKVSVEEAKGSEKCDGWLNTDGHRLVTTQKTTLETTAGLEDHQFCENTCDIRRNHGRIHKLIDNRQRNKAQQSSLHEKSSFCRVGTVESEQQAEGPEHICNSSIAGSETCSNEKQRSITDFQSSMEVHRYRCPYREQKSMPQIISSRLSQKSSGCLCNSSMTNEFETANASLSSFALNSESSIGATDLVPDKKIGKGGIRGNPFVDCKIRKSVSFSDHMLSHKDHLCTDEDVFLSPHVCHSERFILTKEMSFDFRPVCLHSSVKSSVGLGSLTSQSFQPFKNLDINVENGERSTDEVSNMSKIYTGKHAVVARPSDSIYQSFQSSQSTSNDSLFDGRLSDHSDYRTCSTCSCMYTLDMYNDSYLGKKTRKQIDRCSETVDYMYHIAPVDVSSDDVWNPVDTSVELYDTSIEHVILAYHRCDAVYRTAAESSELAFGDSIQCDGDDLHAQSVQADEFVFGRGDSSFADLSQMNFRIELPCESPLAEVCAVTSNMVRVV